MIRCVGEFVKSKLITLIAVIFLVCTHSSIYSQDQIDSLKKDTAQSIPKYNRFRFSMNYSSSNTFFGRRDSIPIPLLSPSFRFTSHNNFFVLTSLVHTNTTQKMFDELDVKMGYRYYFGDRLDASISYSRYFFNKSVTRLNSLVNRDFNMYLGYDFDVLYSSLSFDYTHGEKRFIVPIKVNNTIKYTTVNVSSKDYTLTWMNLRQFYFYDFLKNGDKLIFTPEVDLLFGTQNGLHVYNSNFSNNYTPSPFQFRAYIANLDLLYVIDKWSFNFSPYATFPSNVSAGYSSNPYLVIYGGIYYTWKKEKKEKEKKNKKGKK